MNTTRGANASLSSNRTPRLLAVNGRRLRRSTSMPATVSRLGDAGILNSSRLIGRSVTTWTWRPRLTRYSPKERNIIAYGEVSGQNR